MHLHKKQIQKRLLSPGHIDESERIGYGWARSHMEYLGQNYPDKWVGVSGERVVAVAESKPELMRAVMPLTDRQEPVLLFHVLVNPDQRIVEEISKRPLSFGRLSVPASDGGVQTINVPPVLEDETNECTAAEVIERLRDIRYRSASFDLHCTLLLPKKGLNDVIYGAFKSVLTENGLRDRIERLENVFGEKAPDVVAAFSIHYYRKADILLERMPYLLQHPASRWTMVNNYVVSEIASGGPGHVAALIDKLGQGDHERGVERFANMGREIQRRISGSKPEAWYFTAEQRGIIDAATERGLLISILSNGTQSSVCDCTKRYFPEIPSWQIFTPQVLKDTGKPSLTNAALFILSLGCVIVRNAIEGRPAPEDVVHALPRQKQGIVERWKKSRAAMVDKVYHEVTDSQKTDSTEATFSVVRDALREFCTRMGMPESTGESLLLLPHQHLHVGNSSYHDSLPCVGLGLPFDYVFYTAKDDGKRSAQPAP
jgi:hypothetical protein